RSLPLANAVFLGFAFVLDSPALAGQLLLDLFRLVEVLGGECLVELLLQEDLALGEFPFVDAVNVGEPRLLFVGQRSRSRIRFRQTFHGQFVSAFHEERELPTEYTEDTENLNPEVFNREWTGTDAHPTRALLRSLPYHSPVVFDHEL